MKIGFEEVYDSYALEVGKTYVSRNLVELSATYNTLYRGLAWGAKEVPAIAMAPLLPLTVTRRVDTEFGTWYRVQTVLDSGKVEGWACAASIDDLFELREPRQ